MISTIAAPLISTPTSKPTTVTTGISAFRSACLRITVRRGTPFARAVRT